MVYDQPSQVYFPKKIDDRDEAAELELRDEDIEAVRKVFAAMSDAVNLARGRLQVVVLDHADTGVWGGLPNLHLVGEWRRGEKLVPESWVRPDPSGSPA